MQNPNRKKELKRLIEQLEAAIQKQQLRLEALVDQGEEQNAQQQVVRQAIERAALKLTDFKGQLERLEATGDSDTLIVRGKRYKLIYNKGQPNYENYVETRLIRPLAVGSYLTYQPTTEEIGSPQQGESRFVIPAYNPSVVLINSGYYHWPMTKGAPVLYAGHVCFDDKGFLQWWNNNSGHYQPEEEYYHQADSAVTLTNVLREMSVSSILPMSKFKLFVS